MNETSTEHETLGEREQALLDTALLESDQLLARSLHDDDQRRRRRRWLLLGTCLGGVVMSGILIAIMMGWLVLGGEVASQAALPTVEMNQEDLALQRRMLAATNSDSWSVGAKIGMELVQIPGDRPYSLLAKNWKKIAVDVRKQILKGFTPGMMGNKRMHSRFFDVMHLGMSDKNAEVRSFAANYLKMQGLPDFEYDLSQYRAWRAKTEMLSAPEIMKQVAAGSTVDQVDQIEQADDLMVAGWELWKQRKYADAAKKFQRAVAIDPELTNAWNGLGWAQFNGGESEKAIPAFEKCVALEPKHPAALNGLGQIYLMWGEYERAEKYLLLAAPQAPAAWYGLTRLYLLQSKFNDAKKWAEKALAQSPDDAVMQQMLEAAQSGKLSDELRRVIAPAGKPKAGSTDAARGWGQFQKGKMRTAERLFRRALKTDPENLSAMNGLAFVLLNQGNHTQAQPLFEQYLEREKDAAGPMNGLARCLKASGKVDEAIVVWERMVQLYPGPTAGAVGLATTYSELGEYDKAAKYYQILVDSDAKNRHYQKGLKAAQAKLK